MYIIYIALSVNYICPWQNHAMQELLHYVLVILAGLKILFSRRAD